MSDKEAAKPEAKSEATKPRSAVLEEAPLPQGDEAQVLAVQRARELFRIGDYAGVREAIAPLLTSSNPAMVDAASELQKRIAVDPVQIGFLMVCFAVIVTIGLVYFGH